MNSSLILLLSGCGLRLGWDLDHDEDNDGFKYDGQPADCNDYDVSIHPNQDEVRCAQESGYDYYQSDVWCVDQNCNGMDDEDQDGDGQSITEGDCDDNDRTVLLHALEFLLDGVDNNCNGKTDEPNLLSDFTTFPGLAAGDLSGSGLAGGDVDGDGFSDLVIAAPEASEKAGEIYRVAGGPGPWESEISLADSENVVTGALPDDRLGSGVSVCDVDGDGFADLVLGAKGYVDSEIGAGAVGLFLGSHLAGDTSVSDTSLDAADSLWWSVDKNANAGNSVACGHSLLGASTSDVVVGAPGWQGSQGVVYLISGNSSSGILDSVSSFTLIGPAEDTRFGWSVSAGDINGDDFGDVLVGTPGDSTIARSAGAAMLYAGGTTISSSPTLTLTGEAAYDQAGNSVLITQDLNGDGVADLLVGAPWHDGTDTQDSGRAYIVFGATGISGNRSLSDADGIVDGTETSEQIGLGLGSLGDVNGDGYGDLGVGGLSDANEEDAGAVYLFLGSGTGLRTSLDTSMANAVFWGIKGDQTFNVSGGGEVNGPSYGTTPSFADFLIGAPQADGGAGRSALIFGQATEE